MATATLKDNVLVTAGYGEARQRGTFGKPGSFPVIYCVPAAVGYELHRGIVEVTQAHLDSQPCEIEIQPPGAGNGGNRKCWPEA